MFFCKPCQQAEGWPQSWFTSIGRCEVCSTGPVECFELAASKLTVDPNRERGSHNKQEQS